MGTILAACAALLGVYATPASADDTGSISGCVTDHAGAPAVDAEVTVHTRIGGRGTRTGQDGCFVVAQLPTGPASLTFYPAEDALDDAPVQLGGGFSAEDRRYVEVVAGTPTTGVDARFALAGRISGRVTGPDGTPLSGVVVQATDDGLSAWFQRRTITDAAGRYVLRQQPLVPLRVVAEPSDGILTRTFAPNVDAEGNAASMQVRAGEETVADIAVQRAATVSGRVTDPDGVPIPGAAVSIAPFGFVGWESRYAAKGTTTDAAGRYAITGLHSRTAQLTFSDTTGDRPSVYNLGSPSPLSPPVVIGVGEQKVVDVMMGQGGTISGTLRDEGGRPLVDRQVVLQSVPVSIAFVRTDASGRWRAANLPSGRYEVFVPDVGDLRPRLFNGDDGTEGRVAVALDAPAVRTGVDLVLLRPGQTPRLRSHRTLRAVRRSLSVPLRCPSGCRVTLRAGNRSLGKGRAAARAGTVRVRLTRAGSRVVRRGGRASLSVEPGYGEARSLGVRLRRADARRRSSAPAGAR